MFPQNRNSCFNNYNLPTLMPGTIFTLHVPAHLILTKTPEGKDACIIIPNLQMRKLRIY